MITLNAVVPMQLAHEFGARFNRRGRGAIVLFAAQAGHQPTPYCANYSASKAKDFRVVSYATPVGNAAAYYPETNPLVALDHVAAKSNTPVSKAVVIRLEKSWEG
jgi:hypothetical protein